VVDSEIEIQISQKNTERERVAIDCSEIINKIQSFLLPALADLRPIIIPDPPLARRIKINFCRDPFGMIF
jgi:hypothetical protein